MKYFLPGELENDNELQIMKIITIKNEYNLHQLMF